jgi:hypothetical protein
MKVSELIRKASLKWMAKDNDNLENIFGSVGKDEEYFLITNTKEIFNTNNDIKIFAVMRNNEFQGIRPEFGGWCGYDCYFNLTNDGSSSSC